MWDELCERQCGIITRQQALTLGLSLGAIRARLRAGRWRRVFPGVYATFTGPLPRRAELWAVVLAAGYGAVLSHESAAELAGLVDGPAPMIHVSTPNSRTRCRVPGIRQHVSGRVAQARHPSRLPPQTRIEDTVVDLTQDASTSATAIDWVIKACARRLTTVERLRGAFATRKKLRWRTELSIVMEDVAAGCHSMLEVIHLRTVERPHGLPLGMRQVVRVRRGGRWYDDVGYEEFRTVIELDGGVAHPAEARWRDARRDNAGVARGLSMLRYGPVDVLTRPCELAVQVGAVLRRNGWRGSLRRCGPRCAIPPDQAA